MTAKVELHLRVEVAPERRAEFLAFLRDATPYYEQPGGIRIRLLQDRANPNRFIEIVEYADSATYERDQQRVADDARMESYLSHWRSLLTGPPALETYEDKSQYLIGRGAT